MQDEPGISQNWKTSPRKSRACKTSQESHRTGRLLQGRTEHVRRARNPTELEDFSKEEQCMQDETGISQNWKTSPRKSRACKTRQESHRTGRLLQGRAEHARRARNLTELEDFSKEEQNMQDEAGIPRNWKTSPRKSSACKTSQESHTNLEDFSKEEQCMQDEAGIPQNWKTYPRKSSACKTSQESHRTGRLLQGRAVHVRRARNLTELEDFSKEEQCM
ncbi:uncharacterized protein ACNLHF_010249 isoform 2-T3 [Anomaloglossus baeobatrachus]|uniref:uncharacterized protein LOC142292365 isoform X2 n=1 Tax=Anomaloglossus baeobatrachus TaxID=238106 RepID=UPI003F506FBB